MGNHEFCVHCHENDFHDDRDCDPVKVAKVKEARRLAQLHNIEEFIQNCKYIADNETAIREYCQKMLINNVYPLDATSIILSYKQSICPHTNTTIEKDIFITQECCADCGKVLWDDY